MGQNGHGKVVEVIRCDDFWFGMWVVTILLSVGIIVGILSSSICTIHAPRSAIEKRLKEIEIKERVVELRKEKGLE